MPENDIPAPSAAPDTSQNSPAGDPGAVDLSALKNLSFGPDWSSTPSTATLARKMGNRGTPKSDRDFGGPMGGGAPRRDRRPPRKEPVAFAPAPGGEGAPAAVADEAATQRPRFPTGERGGSRMPFRDGPGRRGDRRFTPPPFRPTHEVLFYPDDAAFRALLKAIRSSCRTYELFEVAHLILQKPERFVVVIKAYPGPDGAPGRVFVSQPDHLPFETEDEAVAHVFSQHLDKFCDVEQVEVEAPKGNFLGVSKCGITGELIAPPNYHRYQELLREHHGRRLSRMPFEKFAARVELVKEPEQLAAWLEKMKKATRYKLKTPVEGAPEFFESLDAAQKFLLGKSKDAIVRALDTGRYPGRMLEQFPEGDIRRSVEAVLEQQRRFPLETANNLRGRLRRMKFHLYKKGAKGVSYICAVKRRFRDQQTVLAEHVQKLITFIEQHPNIPASRLPHEFLGLPLPVAKEKAASPAEAVEKAASPAETAAPVADAAAQPVAPEVAPQPAPAETAVAPAPTANPLSPEQEQQLRALLINLRWLVTEGYVIEYGDGRLFASPPMAAPKAKVPGAEAVEEELVEETPAPFAATGEEEEQAAGVSEDEVAAFADELNTPPEPPAAPAPDAPAPEAT